MLEAPDEPTWPAALAPGDRRLWRRAAPAVTTPFLAHARRAYPAASLRVDAVADPTVRGALERWGRKPQHEYLYRWSRRALVEPALGYVLAGPATLVAESMPYCRYVGPPPFGATLARRVRRRGRRRRERAVVSLRDFGDGNYYHWWNDVLAKLALVERCGIGEDWPLLVSRPLAERAYFRGALARSPRLRRRRFVVQDDATFVEADEVVFAKTMAHDPANFAFVADLLGVGDADPGATGRVFVTRSPRRGRFLENAAAAERVVASYGFEVVDLDGWDLDAQIGLFAGARHVVGIHGAGLANLVFRRRAPFDLLEVFPPDNVAPHYFWMARHAGAGYDALLGSPGRSGGFVLDPGALAAAIEKMLSASG